MSAQDVVPQQQGFPDFWMAVYAAIIAQQIEKIAVDIVAQSLENLKVDIAAQSLSQLNVYIQGANLIDVYIQGQAADLTVQVTNEVSVNIAAQSVDLTIKNAVDDQGNPIPLEVNANILNSIINVSIQESTVTLDVNVTNTQLDVNIAAQAVDLTIKNAVDDQGNPIPLQVDANILNSIINVSIQESTVTLDVNVTNTQLDVNIAAQAVDLTIKNAVDAQGNTIPLEVNANIVNSIINVSIQESAVTLDVNVTNSVINVSGSVDVNIKAQEVKLDVYQKQEPPGVRAIESYDYADTDTDLDLGEGQWTFFLPAGCRGIIDNIKFYAKNTTGADQTITVKLKVDPGAPAIYTFDVTIPADATDYTEFTFVVAKLWNYDSLAISFVGPSGVYLAGKHQWGTGGYKFEDYRAPDYKPYVKIIWSGREKGYLPVSGTVNAIVIPTTTSGAIQKTLVVSAGGSADVTIAESTGELVWLLVKWNKRGGAFTIVVDGEVLDVIGINWIDEQTPDPPFDLANSQFGVRALKYDTTNDDYQFAVMLPIQFKQKLKVRCHAAPAEDTAFDILAIYKKLS